MNYPKISVVTISYNQGKFLEETINSLINQNYPNLEYIIIDGGSSDNSISIIKKYKEYLTYWESNPDNGPANALNKGFRKATGDYFYYLNSDDIILPNALQKIREYLLKYKSVDVFYGHGYFVNEITGKKSKIYSDKWNLRNYQQGSVVILQQATFFKKEIFYKVGGFNEINKSQWDGELLVDFALANAKFMRLPFLFKIAYFRIHSESISGSKSDLERYYQTKKRVNEKIAKFLGVESMSYNQKLTNNIKKIFNDPFLVIRRILTKVFTA